MPSYSPPRSARGSTRAVGVAFVAMLVIHPGLARKAHGGEVPAKASDLFRTDKVWTLHLRFTPEQWAAMEPKGGSNPFDMSAFGLGMFLTPAVMRDGDKDKDDRLSAAEFRELGERWFAAWDRDGDGILDSKQVREGLKASSCRPGRRRPEGRGGPAGMMLQGRKGKRNGVSSALMGVDFEYVHADLEFEGKTFPDVAVRYKGNGTFMESRGSLKRSLKIDLNKYVKGQKLAGVTTLNLHNNVTDAGMMNEVLSLPALPRRRGPGPAHGLCPRVRHRARQARPRSISASTRSSRTWTRTSSPTAGSARAGRSSSRACRTSSPTWATTGRPTSRDTTRRRT